MKLPNALLSSLVALGTLLCFSPEESAAGAETAYWVYVGTFTAKQSKGIYRMRLDPATGALTEPELAAEAPSPAFLAIAPNHRFLYSVNEVEKLDGRKEGGVSAFSLDPGTGKLALLDRQPSAGTGPTHISLDSEGHNALVANYGSGSVAVLPIGSDGKLAPPASVDQHRGTGADKMRQEGPHAHCFNLDPAGRFALACDLGLDKVFVYRFDAATGAISPNDPPAASVAPGSGPRHLAFSPDGKRVYVVNEMACTVTGFDYDAEHGRLAEFQTASTLPEGFAGEKSSAEVAVHPSGKFLYASNRGQANSIAIFRIDPATGRLTPAGHTSTQGRAPRHFGIDPTGTWLLAANQDTDNVVVFRIDPDSGALKPAGTNVHVPTPVCILFLQAGG